MSNEKACEVCGCENLQTVIDLGKHPLCDDLIAIGSDESAIEYPIHIRYCRICNTAHQSYQVPKRTLFPEAYHYRSRHTADVINGMRNLKDACKQYFNSLEGVLILDVGCNDGSLLTIFHDEGAKTIGVEPTSAALDAKAAGHFLYHDYFEPALVDRILTDHGHPDIITFTNVFAHIEDLSTLINSLSALMAQHTLLVIENHYLGSVLDRGQFDTFYHEHPRTYSFTSFKHIAERLKAQMVSVEFPSRYGGNIRVMMKKSNKSYHLAANTAKIEVIEQDFEERLAVMGDRIPKWAELKRFEIDRLVELYGPLYAKAFPGRAAILVKMLGLDVEQISAAYEKSGSMKIGHYIPGTLIPILSDDDFELRKSKTTPILNLAWHISSEIYEYLEKKGCKAKIIDIFSTDEFERVIK